MPQGGLEALQSQDPLSIKAFQYDITCNGYEIASGGIRNHRPQAMVKAFELAGYSEETVIERFGGMYRAFHYGAPPHGGMAAGIDRIVMLICGVQNLREISLFPMNQRAEDLLMGSPSEATPKQLRDSPSASPWIRRSRERGRGHGGRPGRFHQPFRHVLRWTEAPCPPLWAAGQWPAAGAVPAGPVAQCR